MPGVRPGQGRLYRGVSKKPGLSQNREGQVFSARKKPGPSGPGFCVRERLPHGDIAAILGQVVAGGHVGQEHAHDVEVGLQEGELSLGGLGGSLLGPVGLGHSLGALHGGGVPLVGPVEPHLHQPVELAAHHVVVDLGGDEAIHLGAVLEIGDKDLLEPLLAGLLAGPAQHELPAVVGAVVNGAALALVVLLPVHGHVGKDEGGAAVVAAGGAVGVPVHVLVAGHGGVGVGDHALPAQHGSSRGSSH